jgi:hypothetical protein
MFINLLSHERIEVLVAETMKITVFLDTVLRSLVEVYWHHIPEDSNFFISP